MASNLMLAEILSLILKVVHYKSYLNKKISFLYLQRLCALVKKLFNLN